MRESIIFADDKLGSFKDISETSRFSQDSLLLDSEGFRPVESLTHLLQLERYEEAARLADSDYVKEEADPASLTAVSVFKCLNDYRLSLNSSHLVKYLLEASSCAEGIRLMGENVAEGQLIINFLQACEAAVHKLMKYSSQYSHRYSLKQIGASQGLRDLGCLMALKVRSVSLGSEHCLFGVDDGSNDSKLIVFGVGSNSQGQISLKEQRSFISKPVLAGSLGKERLVSFGAGPDYSTSFNGQELRVWGRGSLNVGRAFNFDWLKDPKFQHLACLKDHVLICHGDETEGCRFESAPVSTTGDILNVGQVKSRLLGLASGNEHLIALFEGNKLFGYGSNKHHQLSSDSDKMSFALLEEIKGLSDERILSVSCSADYSLIIDSTGVLSFFGKISSKRRLIRRRSIPREPGAAGLSPEA